MSDKEIEDTTVDILEVDEAYSKMSHAMEGTNKPVMLYAIGVLLASLVREDFEPDEMTERDWDEFFAELRRVTVESMREFVIRDRDAKPN